MAQYERGSATTDMASILQHHASQGRMLYFAYGSNIHVAQMAERCPRSIFVGAASLPAHRFQINERGVANVVRTQQQQHARSVEGLVYLVDAEDERALDRSEGVARGFYRKYLAWVDLTPHALLHTVKTTLVAGELEMQRQYADAQKQSWSLPPSSSNHHPREQSDKFPILAARQAHVLQRRSFDDLRQGPVNHQPARQMQPPLRVKTLVYVSEKYAADGQIRDEYIHRMRKAMADGLQLGMSAAYVERCVDPLVNLKETNPGRKKVESWTEAFRARR